MVKYIRVTKKCNQACIYCSAAFDPEPSDAYILKAISSGEDVIITGGEPTLRKDIIELVKIAKNSGAKKIELQTNGTTLYYKRLAKGLVDAGVTLFNIAFPSHRKNICELITQRKGLHEKRIDGIRNVLKFGGTVRLTMIINRLNKDYIEEYAEFVGENFPEVFLVEMNFVKLEGRAKNRKWLAVSFDEVETSLRNSYRILKSFGIMLLIDGMPICRMKDFELCNVDLVKYRKKDAHYFWKDLKQKEQGNACKNCSLKEICGGVWKGYLELFGDAQLIPITEPLENFIEKIHSKS